MSERSINVIDNRAAHKWSRAAQIGRILWALTAPIFALSPRPLWGIRRCVLRLFGASIGKHVHIYPSCKIKIPWNLTLHDYCAVGDGAILYALGKIEIGTRSTISQYAHICAGTHDWRSESMELLKRGVLIGPDSWVCADAFVGPGVSVGANSIVAARAVVFDSVPAYTIVMGNPAKVVSTVKSPK